MGVPVCEATPPIQDWQYNPPGNLHALRLFRVATMTTPSLVPSLSDWERGYITPSLSLSVYFYFFDYVWLEGTSASTSLELLL